MAFAYTGKTWAPLISLRRTRRERPVGPYGACWARGEPLSGTGPLEPNEGGVQMSDDELRRMAEELDLRCDQLEGEMTRLREELATTRSLAALADRGFSEMRTAMRGPAQALISVRERQFEHGLVLAEQSRVLDAQSHTLQNVAEAVGKLVRDGNQRSEPLSQLLTGQTAVLERLDRIDTRLCASGSGTAAE